MAAALAKFTRPKMHRALMRERLFEHMDEARQQPMVWVVAPAGSGKTTLVASYLEARKVHSLWYQLDAGDDDIGTFFHYLAQAVPAGRGRKEPLPALTPEHIRDLPAYCRHFFRALFARLPTPAIIVLDNYHELPPSSLLHMVIERALAEVPEGICIVVASRTELPRELLPVKFNGRCATIDWSRLRMSFEETSAIAASRSIVDTATLHRIHRLSDGWPAGVALTLQRVAQQGDQPLLEHEAREELFDYFATQVFGAAAPEIQHFLKHTALLPAITADLANQLTGRSDSEAVLDDLHRKGIFLDRRGTRPPNYSYHDLFRAFLIARLEHSMSPEEATQLKRRAGVLLEQAGQMDHAIRLYLSAGEGEQAKRLILTVAPLLLAQGRGSTLRDWIAALPGDTLRQDAWVEYWAGAAIVRVMPAEARRHLEAAFDIFTERGDIPAQRLLCAEVILTHLHEYANLTRLDRWIAAMRQLLALGHPFPSPAVELHVLTAYLFSLSFRSPDPVAIDATVKRVMELLDEQVPPELAAVAIGILTMHLYVTGDMDACVLVANRFNALLKAHQLSPVSAALGSMQLGHAAMRRGDIEEATRCFQTSLQLGVQHALPLVTLYVYSHLGLAMGAIERRDLMQADIHRKSMEEHWLPSRRIDVVASGRIQLWIACRRKQWDTAYRLAERHLAMAEECGVFILICEALVLIALLCAELRLVEPFETAVRKVRAKLEGTKFTHFHYLADMAEAYRALVGADAAVCAEKLRSGFAGSKADQGMFLLRMHGEVLPQLAAQALDSGIEVDHVTHVIRQLRLKPPANAPASWPWPLRIRTLGRFEVQRDGNTLEFSRKAPRKTLALLKAIIAFGGRNVREQRLLDAFWSDEEGDVAARSLTAALHRLRGLLGENDAIVQQGGTLTLNPESVWVDVWAIEDAFERDAGSKPVLDLYRGGFLIEDEEEAWSVTMRERLRGKFIHAMVENAAALERGDRPDLAIECYLRGLDADPVIEPFYQGLMRCYTQLDRKSEALAAYRRLRQMLSISLSIKPSPSTEKLYHSLRLDQAAP